MLSQQAVEKLLKVKEQILQEPEQFDMYLWGYDYDTHCSTACCIAGWLVLNELGEEERNRMAGRKNAVYKDYSYRCSKG